MTDEKIMSLVTDVNESRELFKDGKDIYTAHWYWEKSRLPADKPYYLHKVPMADNQTGMDEYDRFFKINHADIVRGNIIPAWLKDKKKKKKKGL